jgi:hypothetical protein
MVKTTVYQKYDQQTMKSVFTLMRVPPPLHLSFLLFLGCNHSQVNMKTKKDMVAIYPSWT